jgi:hypothetical protein
MISPVGLSQKERSERKCNCSLETQPALRSHADEEEDEERSEGPSDALLSQGGSLVYQPKNETPTNKEKP